MLTKWQLQEWHNSSRHVAAQFHHPAYPHNPALSFTHCFSGLACLIIKTKVRHVGLPDMRRGSSSLERLEAANSRDAQNYPYSQER